MADLPSLDSGNNNSGGVGDLITVQGSGVEYLGLIYQALLDGPQRWVAVPVLATSSGIAGQMAYSTTHLYVCVSPDTWKRVALSTF